MSTVLQADCGCQMARNPDDNISAVNLCKLHARRWSDELEFVWNDVAQPPTLGVSVQETIQTKDQPR